MSPYPELETTWVDRNKKPTVRTNGKDAPRAIAPAHSFGRLRRWIAANIVAEVPQSDALCEFDCRRTQCRAEEWETCDRRLAAAEGELWPTVRPEEIQVAKKRR